MSNFDKIQKPPTSGDSREMYRWLYKACELLNAMTLTLTSLVTTAATITTATITNLNARLSKFGDISGGNYIQISATGEFTLNGMTTVWDDVYPSSVTVGTTGANFPTFSAYNGNLKAYEFVGTGVNLKEMNLGFQFHHSQKIDGTMTIYPHLHLYIPDNVAGGTIKFYMEYTWAAVNQTGSIATATVSGTVVRTAAQGINNNAILPFTAISATGKDISSVLMCRIYRDPADVADTFGASVWLKSTDVHIEKDTLGSKTEWTK